MPIKCITDIYKNNFLQAMINVKKMYDLTDMDFLYINKQEALDCQNLTIIYIEYIIYV
jgi:hypothetical protein